jgi:hypothetical protein
LSFDAGVLAELPDVVGDETTTNTGDRLLGEHVDVAFLACVHVDPEGVRIRAEGKSLSARRDLEAATIEGSTEELGYDCANTGCNWGE